MERGRGRARGQSRGQAQQQPQRPGQGQQPRQQPGPQQRQPGGGPQGGPPQQQPPQPQGAWGARPAQPPQGQNVWAKLQTAPQQPAQPQMAGRGARQGGPGDEAGAFGPSREHAQDVSGAGEQGSGARGGARGGNGGVRGRAPRVADVKTRPAHIDSKVGTSGQKITVVANYFKMLEAGRWKLIQYRVDFSEEIDNTGVKKKLLYQALLTNQDLGGYIFDGTVLYSGVRQTTESKEYFVQDANDKPIRITIRRCGEVDWGDHHYIQVFNIIVRKCLTDLKLQLVGRNYFEPGAKIELKDFNLELWPGYFTSIKQHERDILMNAELQFKVMRMDTMLNMLLECEGSNVRQDFQNKAIGAVVLTAYNNRTYRVDDVDWSANPESRFKKSDGTEISYMQYYQERYSIRIRDMKQPMLVSRSKPREIRAGMPEIVYLVPELCRLTGLTDRQRENFKLMRALADYTRVGPKERISRLQQFSTRLLRNQGAMQELRKWDLRIAEALVQIQARVLPAESIVVGGNAKYPVGRDADWTKDLRSNEMYHPVEMKKLAVVCPRRFADQANDFMKIMDKAAHGMRWNLSNFRIFDIPDDRTQSFLERIENIVNTQNPTLILCVVSNNNAERYSAIKKKCCVDRGVPSQVVVAKNLSSKGVMSIATKVAIQLNCKLGGAPWTVLMPLSNIMVIGYDVCRDTANRSKSFSGMVASLDKQLTRYFSFAAEHKHEEELSDNFASFILLACKRWKENRGAFPERILIYRDGVGDGQIPFVYDHEVSLIKKKLTDEIYKNNDLKMAFVVVSKRINTRIVYNDNNPPPGTVVDDVITLPERYDFYIVSQCVRQGSVAPTSYNVIEDTMGLPPDRMQLLSYKLTHMYYNWSGTVRVPAPCQYAHKLSFLVAQNLHRTAHRNLENTLYYL